MNSNNSVTHLPIGGRVLQNNEVADLVGALTAALNGVAPDRPVSSRIRLRRLAPTLRKMRKYYTDQTLVGVLGQIGTKVSVTTLRKLLNRRKRKMSGYSKCVPPAPPRADAQG